MAWWRKPAAGGRFLAPGWLRWWVGGGIRPPVAGSWHCDGLPSPPGLSGLTPGFPGPLPARCRGRCQRGAGPPLARRRVTAGAVPGRPRHAPSPAMADAKPRGPVSPTRHRHPSAVADLQREQAVQVAMDLEFSVVSPAVQDAARPAIDQPQFKFCPHRRADPPLRRSAAPPLRRSTAPPLRRSAAPLFGRSAVPPVSGSVRATARPARPSPCPEQP